MGQNQGLKELSKLLQGSESERGLDNSGNGY